MSRAGAKPVTRQRSDWEPLDTMDIEGVRAYVWVRNVHDGQLRVIVGQEPPGWHLSISHLGRKSSRYPTWDEITAARDRFLPAEAGFVMHLPPVSEYVALHETTFHLWEQP